MYYTVESHSMWGNGLLGRGPSSLSAFFLVVPKGECVARPERMKGGRRKELMRLVETRRQEEGYPGIN